MSEPTLRPEDFPMEDLAGVSRNMFVTAVRDLQRAHTAVADGKPSLAVVLYESVVTRLLNTRELDQELQRAAAKIAVAASAADDTEDYSDDR